MREMVEPVYHVVETARQAMEAVGVVLKFSQSVAELTVHACHLWDCRVRIFLRAV